MYILKKNMGHLGILGAIVPVYSQKESGIEMGSLLKLLKCVTIPLTIFMYLIFYVDLRRNKYCTEGLYLLTPCQH